MINWEVILWTCITLVILLGVFGLVLVFLSASNMKKQRERVGKIHTELAVGSQVLFAGGIYGKVLSFDEETANVEISKGTIIKISRYAIQALVD